MSVKQRSTYYTTEKVEAVRRNVQKYDWAKQKLDEAVSQADVYLELGWEWLWNLPAPQSIPRSYAVNQKLGCPICGEAHHAYGRWPWVADPLQQPWKLTCPSCQSVFPSNDFAAYYESAKDEHGIFQPGAGDKKHLINELYPDRDASWGVDDGYGWKDEAGENWTFAAYYSHWKIWIRMIDVTGNRFPPSDYPWAHGGMAETAIIQLRDAYLYSGELKYAQAGIVLLDRVADLYPEMDSGVFTWEDGFLNSHGMSGQGKIVGSIWETSLVQSFVSAYDAFYPAMLENPEVADFLAAKAAKYKLANSKASMDRIRQNIEDGILRHVYEGVTKAQIRGNHGMHQNALALAAIVLDEPGTTEEWLDFVFREGKVIPPDEGGWKITGGNMLHALVHDVDRDGFGNEAAPSYNNLWVYAYKQVADIMFGYDRYPQGDYYQNAKFRQMLRAHAGLIMIDRYMPQIGDSDSAGNPNLLYRLDDVIQFFEKTGEPVYAQLAVLLCGNNLEQIRGGLFSPDPEGVLKDIKDTVARTGPFHQESLHLANYGLAAMRDGTGEDQRALWMYHGRNFGHGHRDTLNIGLYAYGLDLSPELGYPEKCDNIHQKTHHWDRSTVAHNTVTVDHSKQNVSIIGQSHLFIGEGDVQVFEADAANVYPQTTMYRRNAALIRIDDQHSYVIDNFIVKGGREHHYSFHGAEGSVKTEGLNLMPQRSGTYAGPNVQYGEPYDADPALKLPQYQGSGFHYLSGVERDAAPQAEFSVDWKIRDTWGVLREKDSHDIHVRLTMLTQADEVALADGHPSTNRPGNPDRLRYLLVKKHADNEGEASRFVSVIEPYKEQRLLRSITRVNVRRMAESEGPVEAAAIRIELEDGRSDYFVHSLDPTAEIIVDERISFQGTVGLFSEYNGEPVYAFVANGSRIGRMYNPVIEDALPAVTGTISDYSRELVDDNWIRVRLSGNHSEARDLKGKYIFVEGTGRNPVFHIQGWQPYGPDEVILDIGHVTVIQDWADHTSGSRGDSSEFRYAIAEGDRFTIPLSAEWRS